MTELILISLSYLFRICNLPLSLCYRYFLLELFLCVFISCSLELALKFLHFLWSRVSIGDVPHPLTLTHDIPCITCTFQTANNETIYSLDDKHDLVYLCIASYQLHVYNTQHHTHTHNTDLPCGDHSLPAIIRRQWT